MAYKLGQQLQKGNVLKTVKGRNSYGGETVSIDCLLSDKGGQGDVYKATWNGKKYALKWYNRDPGDVLGGNQYRTIKTLISTPNPSEEFYIWPQVMVAEKENPASGDLFGYIMELIPDGFYEMQDYLRSDTDHNQKKFDTFHAMIRAGMNVVSAVQALHHTGLSYKDLNPGNLVINPLSGEIKMVDCDNISADNAPCTVNGTRGYMAPEIVRSGFRQTPNIQTDMFSLAIVLFRLFYMDHPMEGRVWANFPLITTAVEDELYSIHPVYNMSTKTDINRPDDVWAPNVMGRMALLPTILMEGFENTFVNGVDHVMGRTPENKWLQILSVARDQLVFLDPKGEQDRVVRFDNPKTIPQGCLRMTIGNRRHELALYPFQSLFKDVLTGNGKDYKERAGRVMVAQGKLCMQNNTDQVWDVYIPGNGITQIPKDGWFFLVPGTQVQFNKEKQIIGVVDNPLAR